MPAAARAGVDARVNLGLQPQVRSAANSSVTSNATSRANFSANSGVNSGNSGVCLFIFLDKNRVNYSPKIRQGLRNLWGLLICGKI